MNFIKSSQHIFLIFIFIISSCHTKKEINEKNINQNILINKNKIEESKIKQTFKNQILQNNIRTVICNKKNQENSLPIINLNSNEKISLTFDDLNADIKNYYFTVIHCNADWTRSNLVEFEYLNGFFEEPINNYNFSFNTIQKYTHYKFEFPSENLQPRISGNYILKVFEKNGKPILYRRIMVIDKQITISANVRRATLAKNRYEKHEIDFIIKHQKLKIRDPFSEIKVYVKQNNRDDNSIINLIPKFIKNDELIYDYEEENIFMGENEFRYFEFSSLRFLSERIKSISYDSTYNHIYLFNDKKRTYNEYTISPDINGEFYIKSSDGWNSSVEADYAFVHFSLDTEQYNYGDIYLFGAFSDWEINEQYKLKYNSVKEKYEARVYLKQGYYNYLYALKDTVNNIVDVSFIEGSHYQTTNDYYFYIYQKSAAFNYDKLIGFMKTSSKELY